MTDTDKKNKTIPEPTPAPVASTTPTESVTPRKVFVPVDTGARSRKPSGTPNNRNSNTAKGGNARGGGSGGGGRSGGRGGGGEGGGRGGPRRSGGADRPRPEYDQSMLSVRRVARVVAGGRRFTFSAAVVIGNRKGAVGVGLGKAGDTTLAIEKAVKDAKKNMVRLSLGDKRTIPHEIYAKFGSSRIFLKPAPRRGLSAGGSVRKVLDLAGITDVNGKIFSRSKNPVNNARATLQALRELNRSK